MKTTSFLLLLILWGLAAGCGRGIPNDAIAGTYTVTLSQEQLMAAGANSIFAPTSEGSWQLEFTLDGVARLYQETEIGIRLRAEGPYALSAREVAFGEDTGDYACTNFGISSGTYEWNMENDILILSAVDDQCEDRRIIYAAQPWAKQP